MDIPPPLIPIEPNLIREIILIIKSLNIILYTTIKIYKKNFNINFNNTERLF